LVNGDRSTPRTLGHELRALRVDGTATAFLVDEARTCYTTQQMTYRLDAEDQVFFTTLAEDGMTSIAEESLQVTGGFTGLLEVDTTLTNGSQGLLSKTGLLETEIPLCLANPLDDLVEPQAELTVRAWDWTRAQFSGSWFNSREFDLDQYLVLNTDSSGFLWKEDSIATDCYTITNLTWRNESTSVITIIDAATGEFIGDSTASGWRIATARHNGISARLLNNANVRPPPVLVTPLEFDPNSLPICS